jgi:DNA-binding response OmpR family regulator
MGKKVLIVEDDSFVKDIYHTKLSQEGYEII